ncbi:uncharacterized protein Z520_02225 [Fonsecaea multimorphosa CBS 102226]|uniref:Copper acquisition factor BIM1-like domain-containing protein n=1 Tax=Fonsecaea multimorphosa CBS 102226 TaxID=1442371 RepID=A0A0D2IYF1_9EURO|nr:uncharacterized protein Z520_02225 [Fonsecaea multimorphosa CBS 102226]KIY02087.1 hypothetical protein Z520_02225 [Fonsecaea multimorphosa CBS 102226]OAL29286.1 hypothetical protein AYO22_02180 [Fonsecaea multimorphosa]
MQFLPHLALLSLWTLCTSAHFILQYPQSLGFDDDIEATAPCGGFDVVFNTTDDSIPVGGFPVSMLSTHPAADWLFRVTLDQKAPFNWTNLLPVVSETGLGQFCLPHLVAPADFAGNKGVIQVIQDGPDGILYQCAAVNFVTGVNSTVSSSCTNVTGLTATLTNQNNFNTSSSSSTSASSSPTASATTSGSAASSSSAGLAAPTNGPQLVQGLIAAAGLAVPFLL